MSIKWLNPVLTHGYEGVRTKEFLGRTMEGGIKAKQVFGGNPSVQVVAKHMYLYDMAVRIERKAR